MPKTEFTKTEGYAVENPKRYIWIIKARLDI